MTKSKQKYFLFDANGLVSEPTAISESPQQSGGPWMSGEALTEDIKADLQLPMVYKIDEDYPGEILPFYNESAPIMRDDLLKVFTDNGVNNLELFPAILKDPFSKKDLKNYKAFNVVGAVDCIDHKKSKVAKEVPHDPVLADMYDGLRIDEAKADAAGLLFFRIEDNYELVLHVTIKEAIEKAGFKGFKFYGPGEFAG